MRRSILLMLFVSALCMSGCAGPAYNWWGNYSDSLYAVKKEPSKENLENHKQTLLAIMTEAEAHGMLPPPGVNCEYGYLLYKDGKTGESLKYFEREEKAYPESAIFVQKLKTHLKPKEQI
jgi:hypothetical protein